MNVLDFDNPSDLAQYVTDNTIPQASIVAITEKDGRWYLFWY